MTRGRRVVGLAVVCAAVGVACSAASAGAGPREDIRQTTEEILAILRDPALKAPEQKEARRDKIQAVTHEGGSGRMQTVRREWNPLYYRATELFGQATGVPVLLNTSFNLRGEPIVNTPINAVNTFGKSDIDTLYMDGFVIRK